MKILVPVTIELPVGVLLYFTNLGDKTNLKPKKAMSAILTGFAECDTGGEASKSSLVDIDTTPFPFQNN